MTTPFWDAFCCGGLSVLVCAGVLLWGLADGEGVRRMFGTDLRWFLVTDLLINWPHFMASYRLLYRDRASIRRHPWVAVVIPLGWLLVIAAALLTHDARSGAEPLVLVVLTPLAHVLLAWHYTGQAWGMTACFGYLGGLRMNDDERWRIRSGMRALFVFHVVWSWKYLGFFESIGASEEAGRYAVEALVAVARLVAFVAFVLGLRGFQQLSRRSGQVIPIRCWLPWLAAFLWYAMIDRFSGTFLLLQAFHALQYMIFPLRVEWNDFTGAESSRRRRTVHLLAYYALLVIFGLVVFDGSAVVTLLLDWTFPLAALVAAAVNFHHYFTDAVIWKIRDPRVRQSLFGHLPI